MTDATGRRHSLDVLAEATYDAAHLFVVEAKQERTPGLEQLRAFAVCGPRHCQAQRSRTIRALVRRYQPTQIRCGAVLVARRFSREGVLETLHHLQRLAQYGVGYRSFTEQYLDSCGIFKDAVLSILATIARQERVRISERVHAGLVRVRKQGRVGGRPRLVLNYQRILAMSQEGNTIREIAEEIGVSSASIHRIVKSHRRVDSDLIPA